MKSTGPMIPAALVLVASDPVLQKLLATWPSLTHHPGPRRRPVTGNAVPRLAVLIERARPKFHEWAEVSGVDVAVIEARAPILFGNRICQDDGVTDTNALSFVASMMLNSVSGSNKRPKPKK